MTYIAIILVIGMICWSWIQTKSIPDSISAVSYIIPKWLFSTLSMLVGILLMPSLMELLEVEYQWVGFLMVVGLACVAASPYYKTEQTKLHYAGAILCFIFAQIVIGITKPWLLVIWMLYPLLLLKQLRKWWILSAEIISLLEIAVVTLQ